MMLALVMAAVLGFVEPQALSGQRSQGFSVGVSTIQIDPSTEVTQSVRVLLWRPIREPLAPATLLDLAHLVCPAATGVADCFRDLAQPTGLPGDVVLSSSQLDALSRIRLDAGIGGAAIKVRQPLVVFAGSIGSRGAEFMELAQLLASRGIVTAIVIPPFQARRPEFSAAEAESAHTRLKRAIASLVADRGVDPARLALAAWSFGGVPAALEAMNNPAVRGLLSLDSAIRYQYGVDLIRSSPAYRPQAYHGRVLSLVAGRTNPVPQSDRVMESLTNARIDSVVLAELRHGDFSDLYAAVPMRVVQPTDAALEKGRAGMLRLSVDFLERVLKPTSAP
jgi:hypothetical protein